MFWFVEIISWLPHNLLIGGNYQLIVSRRSDWWKLSAERLTMFWLVETNSWLSYDVMTGGNYELIVSRCSDWWKLSSDCLTMLWLVETISWLSHDVLIGGNYQLIVSRCTDWWKLSADCLTMLWLVETISWLSHDVLIGGDYKQGRLLHLLARSSLTFPYIQLTYLLSLNSAWKILVTVHVLCTRTFVVTPVLAFLAIEGSSLLNYRDPFSRLTEGRFIFSPL